MAKEKLTIIIDGDAKGVVKASKKAESSISKLGKMIGGLALAGGALFLAKKGFDMLTGAIRKMSAFVKESIDLAGVQEAAIKKLDTALKTSGIHTAGASKRLQEYASALQKVTTYGDETIIEVEAMLATFGATEEVIEEGTLAVLDMAAAMDMDLKAAAILLGKAIAGETGTLSRYGIIIDHDKYATEGFSVVLDALNSKFGGMAQAQAETYSGRLEQMKNRFGDLKEVVGFAIIPVLTDLMGKISESGGLFENLEGWVGKTAESFGKWLALKYDDVVKFIDTIMEADYSAIEKGIDDLADAFSSLAGDETGGIKKADTAYQNFINNVGEGLTVMATTAMTVNAIWESLTLYIGTVAKAIGLAILTLQEVIPIIGAAPEETEPIMERLGTLWKEFGEGVIEQSEATSKAWDDRMAFIERSAERATATGATVFGGLTKEVGKNFQTMSREAENFQITVDKLHGKNISSTHTIYESIISTGATFAGKGFLPAYDRQSGGELRQNQFIPDLEMYGRKGEGIIPEPLMRAIKESRGSFAGVDAGGGSTITNNFNIAELVVREEADIHKISQELHTMQLQEQRGKGY